MVDTERLTIQFEEAEIFQKYKSENDVPLLPGLSALVCSLIPLFILYIYIHII